jgi:hypothetical protein
MAAIVIRENAKATWLPGMARVLAKACDMVRRAVDYAASAVMICAVGTALLQLAVQIASFPAPVAVTAFTLIAVTLFQSLRRHRRARARHRHGRPPREQAGQACPVVQIRDAAVRARLGAPSVELSSAFQQRDAVMHREPRVAAGRVHPQRRRGQVVRR